MQRISYYDNVKFFLIILVVINHFIVTNSYGQEMVYKFIISFHMPIFIFVSGLFHHNKNTKRRIIDLLICYVIFNICNAIIYKFNRPITGISGSSWFFLAIAIYCGITYLVRDIKPCIIIVIAIILGAFTVIDKNIRDMMYAPRIIDWFIFYYVGSITNKEKLEGFMDKKIMKIMGSLILVVSVITLIILKNSFLNIDELIQVRISPNSDYCSISGLFVWFFSFIIALVNMIAFLMVIPHKNLGIITRNGSKTIQVFFWHYILRNLIYFTDLKPHILWINNYDVTGGFVFSLIFSVAISFLFSADLFAFPLNVNFERSV